MAVLRLVAMMRSAAILISLAALAPTLAAQAGLQTVFGRAGDTVVARVSGAVPASAVRRLVETMRIEPTDGDTSLFSNVYEFVVDRRGYVWAFDDQPMSVYLFDQTGTLVRRFGRKGGGPGEFQHNGGMAIMRDGRLAVLDYRNARVSFFSSSGDFQTSLPVPATSFFLSRALRVDTSDAIRIEWRGSFGDNLQSSLLLRLRNGGGAFLPDTIAFPPSPIQPRPPVLVGEGSRRIGLGVAFTPYFSTTWQWGGGFATANGETGVVTVVAPSGRVVRIERAAPEVRVTEAERAEAEAMLSFTARSIDPTWSMSPSLFPTRKPHNGRIVAARDGRIWVQVAGAAEPIPEELRIEPRAGRPPPPRWRSATVWEVYAPTGAFLGRVNFAKGGYLMHADGDTVWVTERTADGFTAIVRYRVDKPL